MFFKAFFYFFKVFLYIMTDPNLFTYFRLYRHNFDFNRYTFHNARRISSNEFVLSAAKKTQESRHLLTPSRIHVFVIQFDLGQARVHPNANKYAVDLNDSSR